MDCEDCKNYEPKKPDEEMQKVFDACKQFCKKKQCEDCGFESLKVGMECPVHLIRKHKGGDLWGKL